MSESKRHKCPVCGEFHTGFTEKCGWCLYAEPMVAARARARVMKSSEPEQQLESVSHGGKRPGAGRKRKHANGAARLRAWREKHG
jgi:hypothetical protein